MHDNSKYHPIELLESIEYYTGKSSPIAEAIRVKGYSLARLHHKGHNPHHWEYWIDIRNNCSLYPTMMPKQYLVEMTCDWIAAGITYSNSKVDYSSPYKAALEYYQENQNSILLHRETELLFIKYLQYLDENGIEKFCKDWRNL